MFKDDLISHLYEEMYFLNPLPLKSGSLAQPKIGLKSKI